MDPRGPLPLSPRSLFVRHAPTNGPLHGYGIVNAMKRCSEVAVLLDPAKVYRTLRRMRRHGWVDEVGEPDPVTTLRVE